MKIFILLLCMIMLTGCGGLSVGGGGGQVGEQTNLHHYYEGQGYVKEVTERPFAIGDEVILEVYPNAGWEFNGWQEEVLENISGNQYRLVLQKETTLTALFTSEYSYTFDRYIQNDAYTPDWLAIGPNNTLYFTDSDLDTVVVLNSEDNILYEWGESGLELGQLSNPGSLAVDDEGNVYLADQSNNRIQKFLANGAYLANWQLPSVEHWSGYDWQPIDVDIAGDGTIYVAANHIGIGEANIYAIDADLDVVDEAFESFNGYIEALAVSPDDKLWVSLGRSINVYDRDGNLLSSFGEYGDGPGQFDGVQGIVVANNGRVIVADTSNHRLQMFTGDGTFLTSWGTGAGVVQGPSRLNYPKGVTVDSSGTLYFSELGTIEVIRP